MRDNFHSLAKSKVNGDVSIMHFNLLFDHARTCTQPAFQLWIFVSPPNGIDKPMNKFSRQRRHRPKWIVLWANLILRSSRQAESYFEENFLLWSFFWKFRKLSNSLARFNCFKILTYEWYEFWNNIHSSRSVDHETRLENCGVYFHGEDWNL